MVLSSIVMAADSGPVTVLDEGTKVSGPVVHVSIKNFAYEDAEIAVKPGTTVVWTNEDSVGHNVRLFAEPTNSLDEDLVGPMLARGKTFSITFHEEGVYEYHCDPHPFMLGA